MRLSGIFPCPITMGGITSPLLLTIYSVIPAREGGLYEILKSLSCVVFKKVIDSRSGCKDS